MYSCYFLSIATFAMLLTAFFQAIFHFNVLQANHLIFMILTSIVYCFTETLVIFFFVGTGVSVKEYTLKHKLSHDYHKRSITIKRKVYPPLMLNLFFMIILFVMVGAVDTGRVPEWIYHLIFAGCIIHFIKIKIIQNQCFKDNTRIILDMSGIK